MTDTLPKFNVKSVYTDVPTDEHLYDQRVRIYVELVTEDGSITIKHTYDIAGAEVHQYIGCIDDGSVFHDLRSEWEMVADPDDEDAVLDELRGNATHGPGVAVEIVEENYPDWRPDQSSPWD